MTDRPVMAALRAEWKEIRREYPVGGVPNEFVERLLAALETAERDRALFNEALYRAAESRAGAAPLPRFTLW